VIEVKRPGMFEGKSIIENKIVLGQLYDYMLRLRSFHGLQNVFGIVTTYNEWRICWLPEADSAAYATSVSTDTGEKKRMLDRALDTEKEEYEEEDVEVTEDSSVECIG
jgi:hypothetical protein